MSEILLVRALFQKAFDSQVTHRESCQALKKACALSKKTQAECTSMSAEFPGVLTACGELFIQVIHTTLDNWDTIVYYMPYEKQLFNDQHFQQILVQNIAENRYLDLDGLGDPFDDEFDKQWTLYRFFTENEKLDKLPNGGTVFCYIHLFN